MYKITIYEIVISVIESMFNIQIIIQFHFNFILVYVIWTNMMHFKIAIFVKLLSMLNNW